MLVEIRANNLAYERRLRAASNESLAHVWPATQSLKHLLKVSVIDSNLRLAVELTV